MSEASLNLRMKLFSDGGPLFHHLTDIQNSSARNTRALQLMYLGLLVESGRLALNGEPSAAVKPVHSVAPLVPASDLKRATVKTPDYYADDLAATFGVSTPSP